MVLLPYYIIMYYAFGLSSSASLMRAPITRYAVGAAIKSEEQVPMMTPSIMANANARMLSPPKTNITRSTMNVDTDVLIVRASVLFRESLKMR